MPCSYVTVLPVRASQFYIHCILITPLGNRIERCLSYDEKPLLLFQKLKDSKKNPVFMLKHIKDIRSPIAVAQQKQAARKASSVISADTNVTSATQGHHKALSVSRNNHRPPKLEVQDLSATTPLPSNGLSPHPGGWPDAAAVSPLPGDNNHHSRATDESSTLTPATAGALSTHSSGYSSGATLVGTNEPGKHRSTGHDGSGGGDSTLGASGREIPPPNPNGISYAVAIYPYMAEMEDEFDVVV
jgi:bZIP factor